MARSSGRMGHFEREAYLQWLLPAVMLLSVLASFVYFLTCQGGFAGQRERDCLGKGGLFDPETQLCSLPGPDSP